MYKTSTEVGGLHLKNILCFFGDKRALQLICVSCINYFFSFQAVRNRAKILQYFKSDCA